MIPSTERNHLVGEELSSTANAEDSDKRGRIVAPAAG
jgi:hypothetical protein